MRSRNRNVVKYRKRRTVNAGTVIFLFIFIYLAIIVISYLSSKHLTIYEVVESRIADDDTCTGLILRSEKVYTNKEPGYINFYVRDGDKVAKKSTIYSVDETGEVYDMIVASDSEASLSDTDSTKVRNYIKSFQKNFSYSSFEEVEDLKYNIEKTMLEYTHEALQEAVKDANDSVSDTFTIGKAKQTGIFSSTLDGFESMTLDDITLETFSKNAEKVRISSDEAVDEDSDIYKIVTDESWNVVLNLSKEQYDKLVEKENDAADNNTTAKITIRFSENDMEVTVPFETSQKGDGYFATLTLDRYMNTFLEDRFVDVQLVLNSAKGLKIPKTSILEKKFYLVPLEYLTVGGDDDSDGLVKQITDEDGSVSYEFQSVDVVSETEKYAYIQGTEFESGDTIKNPDTQETFQIGKTGKLKGVYNVNKGYCVFKQIEVLYENEEYCIVSDETYNGLSNYDHILLDATTAEENEIIK